MKPHEEILQIIQKARNSGRQVLLESEGLKLLELMGISIPPHLFVQNSAEFSKKSRRLSSNRVVLKVVAEKILHKSDVGGVVIVDNDDENILAALREMEKKFSGQAITGYSLHEFVSHDAEIGHELLVGMRWTPDFGALITLSAGGIYAEFLAKNFRAGSEVAVFTADGNASVNSSAVAQALSPLAITPLLFEGFRGKKAITTPAALSEIIEKLQKQASLLFPDHLDEFEINPLVISKTGQWTALDILVKLAAQPPRPLNAPRPIHKLKNLLEPQSIALIGVSEKSMNPGRIILKNILRAGFDPAHIHLVKPGPTSQIENCRTVANLDALPGRVDLLVLAISAEQAPQLIAEAVEKRKAESIILIPGGLEEKTGSEVLVARMRESIQIARNSDWQGPVINGGNCLGVRSAPGRFNTLFIPEAKLPTPTSAVAPVAILSQSGAFAISRLNSLATLNPKYLITVGNQTDLTLGDYLEYLEKDSEIRVFSVYAEGFQPLDGARFLNAARKIVQSGRTVILYRAGRTPAGASASASHTAAIASDYALTRSLCHSTGVILADTLADFEDLTRLHYLLGQKRFLTKKIAVLSNAGFECVAAADRLGHFELSPFAAQTTEKLQGLLKKAGINRIVDVHNPLDLTPMCADEAFEQAIHIVLDDPGVAAAVIGCVPLTPALKTLFPEVQELDSFAQRLVGLATRSPKPFIAVVEGGHLYEPMIKILDQGGVLVTRTMDRALFLLNQLV
ncbi:acetate--CoA ligase family protein [Bdellovibrionota bacterium FG-1]